MFKRIRSLVYLTLALPIVAVIVVCEELVLLGKEIPGMYRDAWKGNLS